MKSAKDRIVINTDTGEKLTAEKAYELLSGGSPYYHISWSAFLQMLSPTDKKINCTIFEYGKDKTNI